MHFEFIFGIIQAHDIVDKPDHHIFFIVQGKLNSDEGPLLNVLRRTRWWYFFEKVFTEQMYL
jgi:hypothetical protein